MIARAASGAIASPASAAVLVAVLAAAVAVPRVARAQPVPAAPESLAVGDFQLWPSVEVRTRGEYRARPVDVGTEAAAAPASLALGNRARVGVGVEHGALRAQITLQDARAWGAVPGGRVALDGTAGSGARFAAFGAYEAYLEARTTGVPRPSFVRVGRQAVAWGEGMLLGQADWSPTGRSLDAIRGRYVLGSGEAEVLGAVLETPRPLGASFADVGGPFAIGTPLLGARASYAVDPLLKFELVALGRVVRGAQGAGLATAPAGSRFELARSGGETYTASLRVFGERGPFDYGVEAAAQVGRASALSQNRRAYAGAAHAAFKVERLAWTPTILAGLALASGASGDAGSGSGTYTQFDPLLPDVHGALGPMDVFALSNVVQARGRVTLAPADDVRVLLEYRYARLAERRGEWLDAYVGSVGAATGPSSGLTLGHELDASVVWQPASVFEVQGGYGALVLGDGARAILESAGRGAISATGAVAVAPVSHFAYLQATLRMP